jgi:hypothetical protein
MENIENIKTVSVAVQIGGQAHNVVACGKKEIEALHLLIKSQVLHVHE